MKTLGQFTQAVLDIQEVVNVVTLGVSYKTAKKTTNNFETFKAQHMRDGYMIISEEGCEDTIFTSPLENIKARVFHDMLHLAYDLGFTASEELKISAIQGELIYTHVCSKYGVERAKLAQLVMELDIGGQVIYYDLHREFVSNQQQFVFNLFLEIDSFADFEISMVQDKQDV